MNEFYRPPGKRKRNAPWQVFGNLRVVQRSDPAGNLYTAGRNSIRKSPCRNRRHTGGRCRRAWQQRRSRPRRTFNFPQGIACAANGSIYVADTGNSAIRTIPPDGTVDTLRNMPPEVAAAVGYGAIAGTRSIDTMPVLLAIDSAGNLFVTDGKEQRFTV